MAVVRTSSSWISKVVPSLLLPTWAVGSGASLSQPAEAGAGIAFGACGGLWTLGILLFVTLFLTNRGRAQRFLRGQLTHIVAWTWAFHVGLTVNLVWVWYRFQGLDRSQRTHWTDRLSWILLTFLPTVPLAVVITVSAVLLIKGRGTGPGHTYRDSPGSLPPAQGCVSGSGLLCHLTPPVLQARLAWAGRRVGGHMLASLCCGVGFHKGGVMGRPCTPLLGAQPEKRKHLPSGSLRGGKSPPMSCSQPCCLQGSLDKSPCASVSPSVKW
ncbi:uncharacterized protein LOC101680073 isoform X1 [Mustela putorius furo]|uniref:Uncharacterized protein LOC101680073 isoform X1 n=1 Tax=Mustela putorius furo TaxID=9669 RepID=A0A8U0T7R2_MUSPF|nr:uncharacterized protein LOC101680073 isoform X1 [Mustela putorius furo]